MFARRFLSLLVVVLSSVFLVVTPHVFALPESAAWFRDDKPDIIETYEYFTHQEADDYWRSQLGPHTQQSCTDKTISYGDGGSFTYCWYESVAGKFSSYGNVIVPAGQQRAGLYKEGSSDRLIPLHGGKVLMELAQSIDGGFAASFWRYENVEFSLMSTDHSEYIDSWELKHEPDFVLRDYSGNPWLLDGNAIATGFWASSNGRYLVIANYTDGKMLRIDLQNFSVLTIDYTLPTDEGATYGTFAVTDDGSQIFVNVLGYKPRMLHVDTCQQAYQSYVTAVLANCDTKDMSEWFRRHMPESHGRVRFATFASDGQLDFQYSMPTLENKYEAFRMFAPGVYKPGMKYLALGDSFASGEGAGRYYAGTDRNENRCHLSKRSYPFLLKDKLDLPWVHSVACSGARIHNIIGPEKIDDDLEDPWRSHQWVRGYDDPELHPFLPGKEIQERFVIDSKPDIITVSVSGNDAGFADFLAECAALGIRNTTCFGDDIERAPLVALIYEQYERLVDVYTELRANTAIGGRVYALGYPYIVSGDGNCANNVRLDAKEVDLTLRLTDYLNYVIERAAAKAGVRYVDVRDSLRGYRLCDEHAIGVHGVSLGFSEAHNKGVLSAHSYHPTAFGHSRMPNIIENVTRGFTLPNPRPDKWAIEPAMTDAVVFGIINDRRVIQEYDQTLRYIEAYGGTPILKKDIPKVTIRGKYYALPGNTTFAVRLYSSPIDLGTVTSNSEGDIELDLSLPEDVEPGFHRLRLFGVDKDGKPLELREVVYVAASKDDWDGDGVPNTEQACKIAALDDQGERDDAWCLSDVQIAQSESKSADKERAPGVAHDEGADVIQHSGSNQRVSGRSHMLSPATSQLAVVSSQSVKNVASMLFSSNGNDAAKDRQVNQHQNRSKSYFVGAVLVFMCSALVCYTYMRRKKHD